MIVLATRAGSAYHQIVMTRTIRGLIAALISCAAAPALTGAAPGGTACADLADLAIPNCGGGTGPNTFEALGALDEWVERGVAPESLTALRSARGRVDRTRPLCAYPNVARYTGAGSIDDAANFACVAAAPSAGR